MKVCQVIDTLRGGGQERVAVEVARGLAALVQRSAMFATRTGGDYERLLQGTAVECHVLDRRSRADLAAWRRASRWLRDRDFDIVHVHSPASLLNMVVVRRMAGLRFRLISHLQMLPPRGSVFRPVSGVILKRTRHAVSATIATNDELRAWLIGACRHDPDRVTVIYNPVDFSRLAAAEGGERPAVPSVVMLAQWRAQKDQLTAIRAAAVLRDRGVAAHWLLVGEVDPALTDPARALIAEHRLQDTVTITGRRTDIPDLLGAATVGVLSTHFEGLPVSVLEYAAAGLPCVVTEVEGTRQIVDRAAGIIGVPEGDAGTLADEVGRLVSDPAAARDLGARARRAMQPLADTPAVIERIRQVYVSALAG